MDLRKISGTLLISFDLAVYAWPITLAVFIAAVWGIRSLVRMHKLGAWPTIVIAVSIFLPAFLIPAYTVEHWADPRIHSPATQEAPLNILMIGWALFALLVVISISMARGFRLPLAGAASCVVWFAAGVYLISVMAVSGVWL